MVPPTRGGQAPSPSRGARLPAALGHWLAGCDPLPGIVSVEADLRGRARVWRRLGPDQVELSEHRFANWFLATTLELLDHLPYVRIRPEQVRASHGRPLLAEDVELGVVELDAEPESLADADAYRYLVLTNRMEEHATALVEMVNKRDGGDARQLADLRGLVLVWDPVEQYLLASGRTYFKGMQYADLRRLQFDLETTGLNEDRDRIFMVSMRDSAGWQECLEVGPLASERAVIERFVELIRWRDPDVLENHNIFGFDLAFLAKRAARLGVRLSLGRDGSEPRLGTDVFNAGERPEPFLRWRVVGRQVVDTQHAVRRFAALAPDLRRHGLKDAARYFGLAKHDREYVAGADVWPTYQTDPARIRRYANDDVDEVDGLSRRLLPEVFGVASVLPRAYERVAADAGAESVWEPLLMRAYLHEAHAIPAPHPRQQRPPVAARSELCIRGVVGASIRASLQPLLPCVMAAAGIAAANDELRAGDAVLNALLSRADPSAEALASASYPYLAGQWLFSDPQAAGEVVAEARRYVDRLADELRARGCRVVEVDHEDVVFATPADWSPALEEEVARGLLLPRGVRLRYPGRYRALYARAPRSAMVLGLDNTVTLVGSGFLRPIGRLERFGETFIYAVATAVLHHDGLAARRVFLDTVHLLRTAGLPLEELAVQVTLHKTPQQYRRGRTHEEPYEALLAAGVRSWRVGQRIRYFRARPGLPRLLQEGDGASASEADSDYYVQRLCTLYCQQFAQAFQPDDYSKLFALPPGAGPFTIDNPAELAAIHPIAEQLLP